MHFTVSHWQPKLIAIDKQPNDEVMHLDGSGKTDRLGGEPLDPGPQRQMFALDLLHVPLARIMRGGIEMPVYEKRRFQHGSLPTTQRELLLSGSEVRYRRHFERLHAALV